MEELNLNQGIPVSSPLSQTRADLNALGYGGQSHTKYSILQRVSIDACRRCSINFQEPSSDLMGSKTRIFCSGQLEIEDRRIKIPGQGYRSSPVQVFECLAQFYRRHEGMQRQCSHPWFSIAFSCFFEAVQIIQNLIFAHTGHVTRLACDSKVFRDSRNVSAFYLSQTGRRKPQYHPLS